MSLEPKKKKTVKITLIKGVEGYAVYLDANRIAGPKPWGGGLTIKEWDADIARIKEIIK